MLWTCTAVGRSGRDAQRKLLELQWDVGLWDVVDDISPTFPSGP